MNDIAQETAAFPKDHNQPPVSLIDELADRYKPQLDQFSELKHAAETAPDVIPDEETHAKVAELIKKMRFCEKTLDGARELERDPFAKKVTEVNAFFKTRIEPLERLRKALNDRSQAFLEKKAIAERKRLQEEEDRRREEARVAMERAQESERAKNAATAAANELENLATQLRTARATATTEVDSCAVAVAEAKVGVQNVRSQIANLNAEFAVRIQKGEEVTPAEKTEARTKFEALLTEAKGKLEAAEEALKAAKQKAADAKVAQDKIDEDLRNAKKEVKTAERDEKAHVDTALKSEKRADKIAEVVAGPEADLSRERSEHGAVSSLGERWKCTVTNPKLLPMEILWPLISTDEKEKAARAWMNLQPPENRSMPGTVMEIETYAATR